MEIKTISASNLKLKLELTEVELGKMECSDENMPFAKIIIGV